MRMTIEQFCDKYHACREGRDWALATGAADMAELWKSEDMPREYRIWIFRCEDVIPRDQINRFALFCAKQALPYMHDQRSKDAVAVIERYLDGTATRKELAEAKKSASAATSDYAALAAAYAALAAAYAADAAADAATSDYAAIAAADAATYAASASAQMRYLIDNVTPNFEVSK